MKKENRVGFRPRLISLAMASLLSSSAVAQAAIGTSAAELGLSNYRHFVIYPHLEKGLNAQKRGDEKTAIEEFEYIHQQVPDSVPLTLYLAEALRHFGHDDRASELLTRELKRQPGNALLETQLAAIPVKPEQIHSRADLLAQEKRCDANVSDRCRSEVGENALRLKALDIAQAQLKDAKFSASPQGLALRNEILQRAIYLKEWQRADDIFSRQFTLSAVQKQQWFDVLLAGHLDKRIDELQAQGKFDTPDEVLVYAGSLETRGDIPRLQTYLAQHKPRFESAQQEQRWLYLLSRYSADPQRAQGGYSAQFAENRRYLVGATLPAALKAKDYATATSLLASLPAGEMLDERYAVSVATHNNPETLRLARQIYVRHPANLTNLDRLSWLLMQAGRPREAAGLLLQRYPFGGDSRQARSLLTRLSGLLDSHPEWATPAQKARLAQPLPDADLRQMQIALPGVGNDCATVRQLLGDMSPAYNAEAWSKVAECYRDDLPGVALYAFQQSEARQPDAYHHRAVAYQAYQVKDYATALAAWKTLALAEMTGQDLLAAANTAQAAGDAASRDNWLLAMQKRGLDNTESYWWLHAQRYLPAQPQLALNDFTKAISVQPSARAYASRATVYRQSGQPAAAVSDLQQAVAMEPENSAWQSALGYALWDNGDYAQSRAALEKALSQVPDDPALVRQLTYVNERTGDIPQTQLYARRVIDEINNMAEAGALTDEQNQQRYDFRRLHEDIGRRWTFSFDSSIGLNSGATSSANNGVGGAAPGQSHRSYGQLEAEYRLGRNMLVDGDMLSVYSRLFADTGDSGVALPVKDPMLGAGLRWKPLYDYSLYLAIEEQVPLDRHHGETDTMLRASASLFNNGEFSDEWHPNGSGWFAQNLYLDAAQYVRQDIQAWTADYRASWHQKVAHGQTVEPYAHIQVNGYRDGKTTGSQIGGVGVRWNIWTNETQYDAWPHKISLGVEYQRTFKSINQDSGERNNTFLTVGVHW